MSRCHTPTIVIFAALCFGCATYKPFIGNPIYKDQNGRATCSLHRLPLTKVQGYHIRDKVILDPTVQFEKLSKAYPNCIAISDSLELFGDWNIPKGIQYCQECERLVKSKIQ